MALRTLSCFTGGYGLELGLELAFPALFEPILYVEGEVTTAGFLAALVEEGLIPSAPVWSDVRTVCDAKVRSYLRRRAGTKTVRGAVQVITGGYPCPDFSSAGKRKGLAGEKGKLWFSLADAIRLYRPDVAFLENVGGHLRRGFQRVRRDLREMGYSVTAGLFTAEEVGDTQKRERLFILARRKGSNGEVLLRTRGSREAGGEPRGQSEQVACREGARLDERQREQAAKETRQKPGAKRYGEHLAGCSCEPQRKPNKSAGTESCQSRGKPRKSASCRGCDLPEQVGDNGQRAGCGEHERECEVPGSIPGETSEGLAELPLFPPGPDSLADWVDVLRQSIGHAPALVKATEPALCRLAHGLARVDVLRILGNGVVPLQAAYAYRTLAAAAGIT